MTRSVVVSAGSRGLLHGLALLLAAGVLSPSLDAQQGPLKRLGKSYEIVTSPGIGASHRLEFKLDRYALETVMDAGNSYTRLDSQGGVLANRKGFAELPFFHATLQLAQNQNSRVVVEDELHEDFVLDHPMLPSKGVIYRNENPAQIERTIAPESLDGGWFPATVAQVSESFTFRDVQGVNVYIRPFQYDAATRTLRVYTRMTLRVEAEGEVRNQELAAPSKFVAEMEPIYQSLFLNYQSPAPSRWAQEVGEVGDMLVIHTARDASAIQPFVQWKREKGHRVKVVQVATGTNVKSIIQQDYAANPGLLYVQLVGDWADIKSDTGTSQNKPMDPVLGCVAGSDNYAELIIGRFSANSASQVTVQVNKAINYEKNPDVSGTWYKNGLVIASSEGAGEGDDGESDIQHETYIRDERLLRTTYSGVSGALGDSSTKSMISTPVNSGVSVINYTGHGSETSWGTTGFNNSDASALSNGNKLPVIVSVACVVGSFSTDCFAEAWMRNPNGGAAAGMFSTINQPWTPPMRGQDYFNDLLTGGYDYATRPGDGTSTTSGRSTFGSLAVNAAVLMYAESSQTDDLDTIQTWTTFGDASMQVRTDTPRAIDLSNATVTPGSAFTTRVTAGGVGVTGALVSLSQGEQVFSGLTDAAGNITLNQSLSAGVAKLVVTGQNTTTISRDITVGQSGALAITTQPANLNAQEGASVTFTVAATGGKTPYTYQWYKNGAILSGATSANYTFTAQSADNSARFKAVVTDSGSASVTSNEATLTVTTVPPDKELILNGGFESGTPNWTGTAGLIGNWSSKNQPAYEGVNAGYFGGKGKTTTQTLYQTVTIPANASSAALSFYLHIDTAETTTSKIYDKLAVQVRDTGGALLSTAGTYSNLNKAAGYQLRTFDLGAYKGQTIRVHFNLTEDSSLQTSFLVDKVSLIVR